MKELPDLVDGGICIRDIFIPTVHAFVYHEGMQREGEVTGEKAVYELLLASSKKKQLS